MKFRIYIDIGEEECLAVLKKAGYTIEDVYIEDEDNFANVITINSLYELKNIEKELHYNPYPVNDISLEFFDSGEEYIFPKMFICND